MRLETNTKLAARNKSVANYLFFATLLVLIGGFFFVNSSLFTGERLNPLLLLLQAAVLPIAFILTLVSIRMTNLWARPPRPEKALPEALKSLSKKSVMYNYYHLPVRHLLISPQGVFAIVTRWHDGRYSVVGDKWRTLANPISRLLAALRMDGVGNPTQEANKAAEAATAMLQPYAPGITVQPLIVFLNSRAQITLDNPTVPVLFTDPKAKPNLKDYMRDAYISMRGDVQTKTTLPLTDEQLASFEKATLPQA